MVTVPPTALELFAQWLAAREAGAAQEFENFVRSHSRFAAELEALHADWKDLRAAEDLSASILDRTHVAAVDESALVAQLSTRESNFKRYTVHGEIARGGMGAIVRVFDEDFRRALAMKVVLPDGPKDVASGISSMSPKLLARFLAEAQITGQLDHPGIVPVHEIGLADDGRLYFTMKLVEGRDLKHIYKLVFDGLEDWNLTRALGVLLKACEAIAYAHKKGVIHRDLKPANIMVGSFGEVFVMDWGLARVLGTDGANDRGDVVREVASAESVRTDRSDVRGLETASGLLTVDGDVLGTPAYMPPEQARGEIESLTARSDVYSLGAMLYQLLSKEIPYVPHGSKLTHRDVLARVIGGPPRALHTIDAHLPAELVAICEKAMERDPAARYPDMLALAEDLRAYLERRVVAAYETGALAEIKKWIARNKALATASAALVLSLLIGMIVSSSLYVKASRETERADEKATEAEQRTDDVLALSAIQDLEELIARADAAWPAHPENIKRYETWLADARMLIDGRPGDPVKGIKSKPGLADHRRKLVEIENRRLVHPAIEDAADATPVQFEFLSTEDRWWRIQLARLIQDLEAFDDVQTGLTFSGTNPVHGWGVEKRLKSARTIEERSVSGASEKKGWADAIASIADRDKCPAYAGLTIVPQLGLVPIGQDPNSGLWEFAHVETGEFPEIGTDGAFVVRDETGLVFVLIPGGTFLMGTQSGDATKPGFDRYSESQESPPHEVTLDPFFLSKYEMTQGQWLRCSGSNPSAGSRAGAGAELPLETPVQQVSWLECDAILKRLGLVIPTEAQWEYAARAGTTTPWWTGDSPESVEGAANVADRYCKEHGGPSAWAYEEWLNDGQAVTSPVGIYRPNAFGLHDVIGNAWEWCRDPYGGYGNPVRPGDGERLMPDAPNRPVRGGSYSDVILNARVPTRNAYTPRDRDRSLGVRPARRLMP